MKCEFTQWFTAFHSFFIYFSVGIGFQNGWVGFAFSAAKVKINRVSAPITVSDPRSFAGQGMRRFAPRFLPILATAFPTIDNAIQTTNSPSLLQCSLNSQGWQRRRCLLRQILIDDLPWFPPDQSLLAITFLRNGEATLGSETQSIPPFSLSA